MPKARHGASRAPRLTWSGCGKGGQMARIRSIKPEILEDEKTANLSDFEWRLFVSMFVMADDYGNLRGDPGYVCGVATWSRGSRESVAKSLESLARVSLITIYRVRGQRYIAINGWSKHQRVDKPGKPHCPGPSEADAFEFQEVANDSRNPRETFAEYSRDIRETLSPDLRSPISDHDQDQYVENKFSTPAQLAKSENQTVALQLLELLSERSGVAYRGGKEHVRLITARLSDGYTVDDLRLVIGYCADEKGWQGDPKMQCYLRPETLFGKATIARYADPARSWAAKSGIALAPLDEVVPRSSLPQAKKTAPSAKQTAMAQSQEGVQ
ncbi:MAG: hypothetical protein E6Q97_05065 [Desulfurellales bacterium]|nr:MAG: hypothetical protein E6Q97_05065 [Desulfurellales bacterium]